MGASQQLLAGGGGAPPLLLEDFNDNSLDGAIWTRLTNAAGYTYTEQNQRMEVAVANGTNNVDALVTVNSFDVTNRSTSVELVDPVASVASTGVKAYFVLIDNSSRYFGFTVGWNTTPSSNFFLGMEYNSVGSVSNGIVFDAVNHRFIRIRPDISANTMVWETSPDNVSWTTRQTITSWSGIPFTRTAMKLRLQWNYNASPGSTKTQIWDNVRIG